MRTRPVTWRLGLSLLGGAAMLHPFAAHAQDSGEPAVLRKIEVTAQSNENLVQDGYVAKKDRIGTKTNTPIARIPQAVSVVTQKQLEDQKPRTLKLQVNAKNLFDNQKTICSAGYCYRDEGRSLFASLRYRF